MVENTDLNNIFIQNIELFTRFLFLDDVLGMRIWLGRQRSVDSTFTLTPLPIVYNDRIWECWCFFPLMKFRMNEGNLSLNGLILAFVGRFYFWLCGGDRARGWRIWGC